MSDTAPRRRDASLRDDVHYNHDDDDEDDGDDDDADVAEEPHSHDKQRG